MSGSLALVAVEEMTVEETTHVAPSAMCSRLDNS